MRYLITIFRSYPRQNLQMLIALLLAGVAEIFGLSALLPLLSIVVDGNTIVSSTANTAVSSTANTASPSAAERLINETLSTLGLTPTIEILLLVIFLAILFKSGLVLFANKRMGYTVAQVATDLRMALLRALLNSRWQFHLQQPVGKMANAMATEAGRAGKAFACGAVMIVALIQAIVAVSVAFLVSWQATLIALGGGVIIFFAVGGLVRKAKRAGWRQTKLMKSLLSILTDSLQSIKPLKSMARENSAESVMFKKTNLINRALQKEVLSKELLRALQEPLQMILLLCGLYLALLYWHLPATTVMVLIFLVARLLRQIGKIQREYQRMVILESGYWSLQDTISKAEAERETMPGNYSPSFEQAIRLDRISFAYGEKQVLHDVSLTFVKGEITAIVGPSGVGKTTIADLVTGLLRPQHGAIWIDDLPLAKLDLKSWRRMIGYVPQETLLLHDTVLTNVTLGDPELSEEDAVYALHAAEAWDFVKSLPQGIKSVVGERGGKLSGGQRQRIAIARALVHKPKLLILDEATTGLDPESEAAICDTLQQLRGELTILAISHQSALVKIADKVYRIQDGKILQTEIASEPDLRPADSDAESGRKLHIAFNPGKLR
jgi:ATP-binding cassette subfamily C protein